jgi:hypothetical protein
MKAICITFGLGSGFEIPSLVEWADCMISVSVSDVLPLDTVHPGVIYGERESDRYCFINNIKKNGGIYRNNNGKVESDNDFYKTSMDVMKRLYPDSFTGNYKYFVVNSDVNVDAIFANILAEIKSKGFNFQSDPVKPHPYPSTLPQKTDYPLDGGKRYEYRNWLAGNSIEEQQGFQPRMGF